MINVLYWVSLNAVIYMYDTLCVSGQCSSRFGNGRVCCVLNAFVEVGAMVVSWWWFVGIRAGGRYRLIMSCIDRERLFFMNEPAHS